MPSKMLQTTDSSNPESRHVEGDMWVRSDLILSGLLSSNVERISRGRELWKDERDGEIVGR